jgi:hypothetical protein
LIALAGNLPEFNDRFPEGELRMKIRRHREIAFTFAVAAWMLVSATAARANGFLPIVQPYESFNDSPFKGMNFSIFTLVSMTDLKSGQVFDGQVPGVTTNVQPVVIGPGSQVDSVDGMGNNGNSLFSGDGGTGITFFFDKNVLGYLPTAAGIVWTDGFIPITFSAKDAFGVSLGSIMDSNPGDFSNGDGNPEHFRFYGVTDSAGISSITISSGGGGGIEVDHLQFGVLSTGVPEPPTMALTLLGMVFLLTAAARRRRADASAKIQQLS